MGRIWTIEQRQKQAERIRSQKPWLKSTGPRTTRGKLASSRNAFRHGCYGAEFKMISLYLKMQKNYIDTLRFMLKYDLFEDETPVEISGNELNENPIKSIQNATNGRVKTAVKNPPSLAGSSKFLRQNPNRLSAMLSITSYMHPPHLNRLRDS